MPGSVAGAIRSALVTRAGLCFCAASNCCCALCADSATPVTNAVTRKANVVFMQVRRQACVNC
jgi:hypothetical protein